MRSLLFGLSAMAALAWISAVAGLITMAGYAQDWRYGLGGLVLFGIGMAVIDRWVWPHD